MKKIKDHNYIVTSQQIAKISERFTKLHILSRFSALLRSTLFVIFNIIGFYFEKQDCYPLILLSGNVLIGKLFPSGLS